MCYEAPFEGIKCPSHGCIASNLIWLALLTVLFPLSLLYPSSSLPLSSLSLWKAYSKSVSYSCICEGLCKDSQQFMRSEPHIKYIKPVLYFPEHNVSRNSTHFELYTCPSWALCTVLYIIHQTCVCSEPLNIILIMIIVYTCLYSFIYLFIQSTQ